MATLRVTENSTNVLTSEEVTYLEVADSDYTLLKDNESAIASHIANTSNPHSVTKTQVGLGNVTDVAQIPLSYLDTDTALTANSDTKVASQKATKAYVDAQISGENFWVRTSTTLSPHTANDSVNLGTGVLMAGSAGIGTTTPSQLVEVVGGNIRVNSSDQSLARLQLNNSATGGHEFALIAGSHNIGNSGFALADLTDNVNRIVVANTTGNVGIGTNVPGAKLDVGGFGSFNDGTQGLAIGAYVGGSGYGALYPYGVTPGAGNYTIAASGSQTVLNAPTADGNIQIAFGGSAKIGVTSSVTAINTDYVGIGVTNPRGKLEVVSGTANTDADSAKELTVVGPNRTIANTDGNLQVATNDTQAADMGGMIGLGGRYVTGGTGQAIYAGIKAGKANSTSGDYAGYLNFSTRALGGNLIERVRISDTGLFGIGTGAFTPAARLEVYEPAQLGATQGNTQIIDRFRANTGNNFFKSEWLVRDAAGADWTTARWHDGLSVDTSFLTPMTDTRTWWERDPNNDIQSWGTATTAYMTISAGNVGIGTTVPSTKLDVQGDIINIGNSGADASYNEILRTGLSTYTGTGNWRNSIYSSVSSSAANSRLKFSLANAQATQADVMTLTGLGYVGIGTTEPTTYLDVRGITRINDGTDKKLLILADSNMLGTAGIALAALNDASSAFIPLTINASNIVLGGNVGIGTTSPLSLLHIEGNNPVLTLKDSTGASADESILYLQNVNGRLAISKANDAYDTFTNLVSVLNNGNVGIGTTSPTGKLDVSNSGAGVTAGDFVVDTTNKTVLVGRLSSTSNDNSIFNIRNRVGTSVLYISAGNGNLGLGTATPNANAILDCTSTTKAFMPPRVTTTQKNAISTPTEGMVVFDITTHTLSYYNGTAWV